MRMFPTYAENGRLYLQVQENNEFLYLGLFSALFKGGFCQFALLHRLLFHTHTRRVHHTR